MKCQCKDNDGIRCNNEAEIESDGFMDQETHGYGWWFVLSMCLEHGNAFDNHEPFPQPKQTRRTKGAESTPEPQPSDSRRK